MQAMSGQPFDIVFESQPERSGAFETRDPPLFWHEIVDCLEGRHEMAKPNARPPNELPQVMCPRCGEPMRALYWANADVCWQSLCGVAGWIRYCGLCKGWTTLLGDVRVMS